VTNSLIAGSSAWTFRKIGDIATKVGSGSTPRGGESVYQNSGVPLIRSMNVHCSGFKSDGLVFIDKTEAKKLDHVTVQSNDVLLNITGASIGRVTTAPKSMAGARVNQHVCIIRPTTELLPSFLAYYLSSPKQQTRVMNVQVGATRQALTKAMILHWDVPVPHIGDQQNIVAEIEKQFSRLDEAVANLKHVKANLKRYKAAVLKAAVEGQLTEDWRKQHPNVGPASKLLDRILAERRAKWNGKGKYKEPIAPDTSDLPLLPKGWTWATIEQLSSIDVGFAFKSAEFSKGGIRLLRGENMEPGSLRWDDTRYWPESRLNDYTHLLIREGDIVLAMDRPLISTGLKIARARATDLPCLLVQRMARFLPVDDRMTPFIFVSLNSDAFVRHLLGGQTGTQLPHISGSGIQSFLTPIPPIKEQEQIVADVERRFSVIDELEATVEADITRADRLRQSILQRAFAGELLRG
jgi:type I restriction enzyme, S subunit